MTAQARRYAAVRVRLRGCAVTLSSGTVTTLVTGVKAAQGLVMRADGTFLVTDEKSGDIRVAMGC